MFSISILFRLEQQIQQIPHQGAQLALKPGCIDTVLNLLKVGTKLQFLLFKIYAPLVSDVEKILCAPKVGIFYFPVYPVCEPMMYDNSSLQQ
jgi:hypothetical protein